MDDEIKSVSIDSPITVEISSGDGGGGGMPVKSTKEDPVWIKSVKPGVRNRIVDKAERYQADLARMIYANNNFTNSPKSAAGLAKDAIKNAQIFWAQLPGDWKEKIVGDDSHDGEY